MATMMPGLPTQPAASAASEAKDGFSRALVIGTSIFGGSSAVYLIVQVIREEPDRAFKLLNSWGPGFLLAFFIAFLVDRLIRRLADNALRVSERSSERSSDAVLEVAVQMRSIAEAANRQASAMQAMAEREDRDKQEMQTLLGVLNSKVDQALDENKRGNRALERIENALQINKPAVESDRT
jgi:hypothetical protein